MVEPPQEEGGGRRRSRFLPSKSDRMRWTLGATARRHVGGHLRSAALVRGDLKIRRSVSTSFSPLSLHTRTHQEHIRNTLGTHSLMSTRFSPTSLHATVRELLGLLTSGSLYWGGGVFILQTTNEFRSVGTTRCIALPHYIPIYIDIYRYMTYTDIA